jgi:hypothetical protein
VIAHRLELWLAVVAVWYAIMAVLVIDGNFRELIGPHHNHIHRLVWQFHTGLYIHPNRTYGGEKRLTKTAISSNRATPEGSIVYWSPKTRVSRAIRRNAIVIGTLTSMLGFYWNGRLTVQMASSACTMLLFLILGLYIRKMRAKIKLAGPKTLHIKNFVRTQTIPEAGPEKIHVIGGTVLESKPSLSGGVPATIMAGLISDQLGCSTAETITRLEIGPDTGTLQLPDHYTALIKQRQVIEEIISAQTSSAVKFRWQTTNVPRTLKWIPTNNTLPRTVLFRDWVKQLQTLPIDSFGVGLTLQRELYVSSHGGDTPWHLRSAGSGTGKSTGFQVKLAQICHQDPDAEVYCIDTKQVSFGPMRGIPGVHIYDDPVDHMMDIWRLPFNLRNLMRERYTAVRSGRRRKEDFCNIWILCDEGNDLASQYHAFYTENIKEPGDPAAPKVWLEAVAPLIYQGREVGIRGEFMFQNMTDKALGGVSLRDAFNTVGMAGYKRNQWTRIVGTTPVPECRIGPGKIMMINGPQQEWVQGFFDDAAFLKEYAMTNRRSRRERETA